MKRQKLTDTYTKVYKMRPAAEGLRTIEVSLPKEVIEREARKRGMTLDEFIEKFRAIAHYNAFDGVFYTFEPVSNLTELPSIIKTKHTR